MVYKGKPLFQVLELKKRNFIDCDYGSDTIELLQSRVACGVNYITLTGEPNYQGRIFYLEDEEIRNYPKPYGNASRANGRECKMYAVPISIWHEIPYEKIEPTAILKDDYDEKRLKAERHFTPDKRIYTTTYDTICQVVKPLLEEDLDNIYILPLNEGLKSLWENETLAQTQNEALAQTQDESLVPDELELVEEER